jgi:hypothetical protein
MKASFGWVVKDRGGVDPPGRLFLLYFHYSSGVQLKASHMLLIY